jgi:predicted Fe-Mo cluster-binding NifX family protein
MRVAVTSQGNDLSTEVDPRFGRCSWFIIADTEDGSWEAVDNSSSQQAAHGAGIQAAQTVSRHGVQTVLTGHCGPKAYSALGAAGITVVEGASGTVSEALEKLKRGESASSPADRPRVHCGGEASHKQKQVKERR